MRLVNRILCTILSNYTDCKNIHNHTNEKNLDYYVLETVKKINLYKKYKIDCTFIPQANNKNYENYTIKYDSNKSPDETDVQKIINSFFECKTKSENKKREGVVINLNLNDQLNLNSESISINANRKEKKITLKLKFGFIPITHKTSLAEYPVIQKLIAEENFDLKNIEYVLYPKIYKNNCALLFYHTKTNKKNINNFIIIILGDKQEKRYHIFNIIGIIFCVDEKTFMLDMKRIKTLDNGEK